VPGEVVPVRAVERGVPVALARLAEAMLARDAAARPRDIDEVARRLAAAGWEGESWAGQPPFVGRQRERATLLALMSREGAGATRAPGFLLQGGIKAMPVRLGKPAFFYRRLPTNPGGIRRKAR